MITSDSTRSKLLELVAELRSQKAQIEKQFHDQLEAVDQNLHAVERTLSLLLGDTQVHQDSNQLSLELAGIPEIAQARTQPEALKIIARQHKGIINVTNSADVLIRAGRAKGKRRNLIASLHTHLKGSEEWEWVSPGNFRLKSVTLEATR